MVSSIISQFEEHDRRIFWSLVVLLFALMAAYVYFLGVSVYAVMLRKHAEQYAYTLNAQISTLQSQYVDLDKKIDLAMAHELGFNDVAVPHYVIRGGGENSLSMLGSTDSR